MCGRDARVPGWASSTQQTGNLICTPPRIGARRRLQASRITPGNAGVSPATLFLAGGGGASAQGCRQPATLPACTALASPNERQDPVAVPSQRRRWPRLRQARRRLQASSVQSPLRGSGQGRSPTRERGRPARNLIPGWRWWSVGARLQAGSLRVRHWPVRMKGEAPLPFHPGGAVGQGCAG